MKNHLLIFVFLCLFIKDASCQINDTISAYNYVDKINVNCRIRIDTIFCTNNYATQLFFNLIDTLSQYGALFEIKCGAGDSFYYFDSVLINVYNDLFHTSVFNHVLCSRGFYFIKHGQDTLSDWVEIKIWCFDTKNNSKEACNLISTSGGSNSYFIGPSNCLCFCFSNCLILLCGGSVITWEENSNFINTKINEINIEK